VVLVLSFDLAWSSDASELSDLSELSDSEEVEVTLELSDSWELLHSFELSGSSELSVSEEGRGGGCILVDGAFGLLGVLMFWLLLNRLTSGGVFGRLGALGFCRTYILRKDLVIKVLESGLTRPVRNWVVVRKILL
jgi:hypothetical protein